MDVWVVSPDPPDRLAQYSSKEGIEYILLSDGDQNAIRAWGIVNPENPKVPHPTAVVVDGEGVVRYLRQDVDYNVRPSISEILEAVDSVD